MPVGYFFLPHELKAAIIYNLWYVQEPENKDRLAVCFLAEEIEKNSIRDSAGRDLQGYDVAEGRDHMVT